MRQRIRERAEVDYQVARSNASWWEHQVRTLTTAGLISFLEPVHLLDPACGDGSLVKAAHALRPITEVDFLDVSQPSIDALRGWLDEEEMTGWYANVGDCAEYLDAAAKSGLHWDVIVLTEFLEHVPDPERILRLARPVATHLIASSPLLVDPHADDDNEEHLWAFDNEAYHDMLAATGWIPMVYQELLLHQGHYNFQIWMCN